MSHRELKAKGVAGALQAKSLDLTQFARARKADNTRALKVSTEDAVGALAFAGEDVEVRGETRKGDQLPGMLLRLKYANQWSKANFNQAHLILLKRHGWNPQTHLSETMFAIAYAAIVEWVTDPCPKCRGAREGAMKPQRCPACMPPKPRDPRELAARSDLIGHWLDPWGKAYRDREGAPLERRQATTSPQPGCGKCGGLGRIFQKDPNPKGLRCAPCGNSGRRSFPVKQRWFMVADFLQSAAKARREPYVPLPLERFKGHWMGRYHKFLGILRNVDEHHIGAGLDLALEPGKPRGTDPEELDYLTAPESMPSNTASEPEALGNSDEISAEDATGRAAAPDEPRVAVGDSAP